jgi:hypothetical protein
MLVFYYALSFLGLDGLAQEAAAVLRKLTHKNRIDPIQIDS